MKNKNTVEKLNGFVKCIQQTSDVKIRYDRLWMRIFYVLDFGSDALINETSI